MDNLALLTQDNLQEDQVLETDIMRFVAIIGIVFWILFSIVKSIPFQAPEQSSLQPQAISNAIPIENEKQLEPKNESKNNTKDREPVRQRNEPKENSIESLNPINAPQSSEKNVKQRGLQLQFNSRDDLLALIHAGKIRAFCRAKATGFDLHFEGFPKDGNLNFKGTAAIPQELWEIKHGQDREWFLSRLDDANPSLKAFPIRQVLIAFTDKKLESNFVERLETLESIGTQGILSIYSKGKIRFKAYKTESKNTSDTDGGAQ
ncbi:hypothetical protein DSCO28_36540 [Desulfosarcina ovata subsp. sediminis]|uniref:Uncharacterized protein n=1 Tax=Desulfosarcina ovata subsp. sediminis TaxID=885957 RepID=A0A5K7ZSA2_9BACT|nr:hypothetical protein [Desulfosarcina ovata]BBO83088.1 hypothetical protein DSCO28_36540 [Desulfosarcina ovata subsp. sediminis]